MKKHILTLFIGMVFLVNTHAQNTDKMIDVPIYEYGDSIVSCETNFKNLFTNWTVKNITNAPDYKLLNYSFLESISDSVIFKVYSRLFTSSTNMLGKGTKSSSRSTSYGSDENRFVIEPRYFTLKTLFSTKDKRVKKLFEDLGFTQEMWRMYSDDFIVNESKNGSFKFVNSPDSLSDAEYKKYILEGTRTERMMAYDYFKNQIKIGDLVYVIHFRYNGKLYSDYVVCDPDSKKVIFDSFFSSINIRVDAEKIKNKI